MLLVFGHLSFTRNNTQTAVIPFKIEMAKNQCKSIYDIVYMRYGQETLRAVRYYEKVQSISFQRLCHPPIILILGYSPFGFCFHFSMAIIFIGFHFRLFVFRGLLCNMQIIFFLKCNDLLCIHIKHFEDIFQSWLVLI